MKYIYYLMTVLVVGLLFSACYDKENTIRRLPDLVIGNVASGSVKTGEPIEITPTCTMGGEEVECTYNWYRYHGSLAELISEEASLEWRVDTIGSVTLQVEATHVETGIQSLLSFTYTIGPRIDRGWLILKETSDGNTDMDVSLVQANGTEFATDVLSLALGQPMRGRPVSVLSTDNYMWYNPETGSAENYQVCLTPVSEKEILMYRVADEKVLVRNEDLFFEVPDFASGSIEAYMKLSNNASLIHDGRAHLMQQGTAAFMPALLGNYHLAPYQVCYGYSNPMLVYDELNSSFGLLQSSSNMSTVMEIKYFDNAYRDLDELRISPSGMNADLIYMGQTDGSIDPEHLTNYGTAYALMQKKDDRDNLLLYGLTSYEWYTGAYSPIRFARTIPVSRCEAFATADFYTMHQTRNQIYFIKDNQLSYYDIDDDTFVMNIHTFEGEVTYCKYIANNYDYNESSWSGPLYDSRFDRLLVATSSGTGYTIHSFNWFVNGGLTLVPDLEMRGEGKVRFMLWYTSNWRLFNNIYRYS